jgi:hypothetical protein
MRSPRKSIIQNLLEAYLKIDNFRIFGYYGTHTKYEVSEELAMAVSNRYESSLINSKYKVSNYVDPIWQNCPNRVVSPYVARIMKEEA